VEVGRDERKKLSLVQREPAEGRSSRRDAIRRKGLYTQVRLFTKEAHQFPGKGRRGGSWIFRSPEKRTGKRPTVLNNRGGEGEKER